MRSEMLWSCETYCPNCTKQLTIKAADVHKDMVSMCSLPYSSENKKRVYFYTHCPHCGEKIEVPEEIPEEIKAAIDIAP